MSNDPLQAGVGLVGSALGGGPALSRVFHAALERSIAQNFSHNHAINCMCHSTENMYRWARRGGVCVKLVPWCSFEQARLVTSNLYHVVTIDVGGAVVKLERWSADARLGGNWSPAPAQPHARTHLPCQLCPQHPTPT